jgi:hypothetical protein
MNPYVLFIYLFIHPPTWIRAYKKHRCRAEYADVSLHIGGKFFLSWQKLWSRLSNDWRDIYNVFAKNQICQPDSVNCWIYRKVE